MTADTITENFRESIVNAISPAVLVGIFMLTVAVFIIVSVALLYHWRNFNANPAVTKRIIRVYFLISGMFLLAMLAAAVSYST